MRAWLKSPIAQGFAGGAVIALLMLAWGLIGQWLRLPPVGFLYDDGVYLSAARALAHGQGYAVIDAIGAPPLVKYPPLFPALIAGLLTLAPTADSATRWLQGGNLALSAIAIGLCAAWSRQVGRLPLILCLALSAAMASNGYWLQTSASLMSEPLYLTLSMIALLLAHRWTRHDAPITLTPLRLAILALTCTAAFYTRSVGISLIAAMSIWLGLRFSWKTGVAFAGLSGAICLPWWFYTASHPAPVFAIGAFLARTFQESYAQTLAMDLKTEYSLWALYRDGIGELLVSGARAFAPALDAPTIPPVALTLASVAAFITLLWQGIQAARRARYSVAGLYLTFYLALLALSSYHDHYPRLLIVIVPIALSALLGPWALSRSRAMPWGAGALALTLWLSNTTSLLTFRPLIPPWISQAGMTAILAPASKPMRLWSDNLDDSYIYALQSPTQILDAFVQLPADKLPKGPYTPEMLTALFSHKAETLRRLLIARGVTHVILNRAAVVKTRGLNYGRVSKLDPAGSLLLQRYGGEFTLLATTPDGVSSLYRFEPRL
ncbi:MAG: hypothetical protein IPK79_02320 [Vampirovibrionales bacterium]|nr:hypothetical protein [Vampirovibrionales bacterium]